MVVEKLVCFEDLAVDRLRRVVGGVDLALLDWIKRLSTVRFPTVFRVGGRYNGYANQTCPHPMDQRKNPPHRPEFFAQPALASGAFPPVSRRALIAAHPSQLLFATVAHLKKFDKDQNRSKLWREFCSQDASGARMPRPRVRIDECASKSSERLGVLYCHCDHSEKPYRKLRG